ncbi:MAG: DNA-directed RNA polymerase subunit omega [Bacteroidetes bacterium]|nr:DNA-directed RNA polymerase subunit omega [Bacteroidota bacterium]MBU2585445.1 DNA-directed RNA polymerase subunit omega [Bacteroidota bacterium]
MPLKPVDVKELEKHAENIYESIVVISKRARQINDDMKIEYNKRVAEIPGINQLDEQEEIENPDQIRISKELEKQGKSTERALKEFLNGEVEFRYIK